MADIRDEHGRPIQLTDELGRPVQLTDEHGAPIHLTGVATTHDPNRTTTIGSELHNKTTHDHAIMGSETHGGTHFAPTPIDYAKRGAGAVAGAGAATMGVAAGIGKAATGAVTGGGAPMSHTQAHGAGADKKDLLQRSTSSSSSSSLEFRASEDDGQGGRRKKKGLMQKIKERLPGSHNSEKEKQAAAHSTDTKQAAAHSTDTKVTTTVAGGPAGIRVEQEHEKKGFMDKIKDKLPGHH